MSKTKLRKKENRKKKHPKRKVNNELSFSDALCCYNAIKLGNRQTIIMPVI